MISEFAIPEVQNPFGTEKFQNINLFHMTNSGEKMTIEKDKNAIEHRKNILLGYMRYSK